MLQNTTQREQVEVSPLRNMLRHLLGLMSQKGEAMTKAMQETVGLIRQSGVSNVQDWLHLLADTNVNNQVLKTVTEQINSDGGEEEVDIKEGTIKVATDILPLINTTKRIKLWLERDTREIEPFFEALTHHKLTHLSLWHHYTRPHSGVYSDDWLRQAPK